MKQDKIIRIQLESSADERSLTKGAAVAKQFDSVVKAICAGLSLRQRVPSKSGLFDLQIAMAAIESD